MPPRSHRGGAGQARSQSGLIIPFALTLTTAALASAGLYFFSANSATASYPGSDSEQESDLRRRPSNSANSASRRRREQYNNQRRRVSRDYDRITEEDTDAIEESRREDELRSLKKRHSVGAGAGAGSGVYGAAAAAGSYMKDAASNAIDMFHESRHDHSDENGSQTGGWRVTTAGVNMNEGASVVNRGTIDLTNSSEAALTAAGKLEQYVPPPPRKKSVIIVVSERKATQGHESDNEFEEAIIPTRSLLSQLPCPLKLTNVNVHILIHSPHLTSHPLSTKQSENISPDLTAALPTPELQKSLTVQSPSPMPSPSLAAQRHHEDLTKSSYDLALSLLPPDSPRENIMPFQETSSIVALLRQLDPSVVYFEESVLEGEVSTVENLLQGASVGVVVVVVGGGPGDELAGLVSEDEAAIERRRGVGKWWEEGGEMRRKYGKRLEVVEGWVLEEDWRRRVEESL